MEELVNRMKHQIENVMQSNPYFTERDINCIKYAMASALIPIFIGNRITDDEYNTLFEMIWDKNNWALDLSDKEVVDV